MTQRSGTERDFFLDLSARAKLRVTGADRFRFINGQITNDLRKANETAAIEACVLNAKGKLNAQIFIAALGESFFDRCRARASRNAARTAGALRDCRRRSD